MRKIIKAILGKFGYQLQKKVSVIKVNPLEQYDYGKEALENIKIVSGYSMMPEINLVNLYEQAIYCEKYGIEGSFVECGVWKGGAIGMMALANMQYGKKRRNLHLFDAFDDICEPNPEKDGEKAINDFKKFSKIEDISSIKGELKPVTGFYDALGGAGSIDICKQLLFEKIKYSSEFTFFHKGWFQDTVPVAANDIEKIALLRLDGDWYESIKVCLNSLYDKVSKNGLIVIDDYGYYEGCTRAVDEFLKDRGITTFLSYSNAGCRYFLKT